MLLCACDPHRFEREQIIFGKSWEELGTLIKMPAEHVDRSNMQNQIIIQIRQNFQPPPFFFFPPVSGSKSNPNLACFIFLCLAGTETPSKQKRNGCLARIRYLVRELTFAAFRACIAFDKEIMGSSYSE